MQAMIIPKKVDSEDEWAQVTMRFDVESLDGQRLQQFNVFERQLSTTNESIFNWRISLSASSEKLNEVVQS